jgi:hypothetical protein
MGTYRLFPSTNGPSSPVSYSGPFLAGVVFCLTTTNCWFEGYWWWVCPSGQSTSPQKFALWQIYGNDQGNLVPGSVVTSGTLTAGQWNYVPLPTPLQLSIGNISGGGAAVYQAATGFTGGFPDTNNQFASGETFANGIASGPLFAYADLYAPAQCPTGTFQGGFSVAGTDPSVNMPAQGSNSSNFWMDVQVSDTAPAEYAGSYRLWPNFQTIFPITQTSEPDTVAQTLGTQFTLSQACNLNNVWFNSPAFAVDLPASTQIWNAATQSLVSGTDLTASWSGPVASGWVANSYAAANIVLPAGNYIATVYYGGGNPFFNETRGYFGAYQGAPGPGTNGIITTGPLSSPSQANAFNPPGGNSCYYTGGTVPMYPNTWDSNDGGENRWVDVEVTASTSSPPPSSPPPSSPPPPPPVKPGAFFVFFP